MKQIKYTLLLVTTLVMSACGSKTSFSQSPTDGKTDASSISTPTECDLGTVCLPGNRSVVFKNAAGATLAVAITSSNSTGFTALLQAPSGRSTQMEFLDDGTTLTASAVNGWRPQLCISPSVRMDPCAKVTVADNTDASNCLSAIYWTGDATGDTVAQKVVCPQ